MYITIEANDERPLYKQAVEGFTTLVARADLRKGMTLPSVRQIAGDLGVNLNTIAVAYRELQEEGFLTVRHGSGTVVSSSWARGVGEDEFRGVAHTCRFLACVRFADYNPNQPGHQNRRILSDREIVAIVKQELELLH